MNISKRDVLELRRRMTKKGCTFTQLCGCYVDGNKQVILKFSQPFSEMYALSDFLIMAFVMVSEAVT